MVKAVGSKQRDVKNANHRLILTQLRQHDLLSRSELARMLSLSAPSISKNVDDLIGRNVLIETGTVPPTWAAARAWWALTANTAAWPPWISAARISGSPFPI